MDKYEKLRSHVCYFRHPTEDIVIRTVPIGEWCEFYARFSGGHEYKPSPEGRLVNDAIFMREPEWITKEEYYNF